MAERKEIDKKIIRKFLKKFLFIKSFFLISIIISMRIIKATIKKGIGYKTVMQLIFIKYRKHNRVKEQLKQQKIE